MVSPEMIESVATEPYWVFVCNPKKWAIDRFLDRRIEQDTWGVRLSDRAQFAPGQLGIVRVGVDRRSLAERRGAPPLRPGIYAVCEVESIVFAGTGASDEFWSDEAARKPGWPTIKLRYLRSFLDNPLTIERMRTEAPDLPDLLLNGFQAASFPLTAHAFHRVMELLSLSLDHLETVAASLPCTAADLAVLEDRYLHASPEVKERVSRFIERGPVGAWAKKSNGYLCQVCDVLGLAALGFTKRSGEPYVEAHHVMPVARRQVGSLALSNIITVCANHHRQLHYGTGTIEIKALTFELDVDGTKLSIPRLSVATLTTT